MAGNKRPQERWDDKAGMVAKTYKVRKTDAEAFAEVCKENGVSLGITLSILMRDYVKQNRDY